jgi:hypothetical protein
MTESEANFPFNHTGKFHITSAGFGGPVLNALLSVPHNSSSVTGHGLLTQATHPPLNAETHFQGLVHVVGLPPGPMRQVYAVQGMSSGPGMPFVSNLIITLDGIWGSEGKASYTYVTSVGTQHPVKHMVENATVSVKWLLQE